MSTQSLTAKYRPQRFADVAGQEAVKSVLSRASMEGRIAPAYLFSGTRGVGKTTVARIFAKAVNCETAPTAEPCNECRHCKAITAGAAVDVVEIDAASNRGIDDARRLKEDIGYAPIECRYKVFIVDEAHMLTREAFNALLKTLEEPPPHATFVLATTEPHKFPATIVSRCQHYVFKRLPQKELEAHLRGLLEREGAPFEPAALTLLARRGAGSVRDSMSLLSQALAMGGATLTASDVREVLGLAGREMLLEILTAVAAGDCPALSRLLGQVLDQGLDLGFFLRELAGTWRDLFLLAQSQGQALDVLDMPAEEARELAAFASRLNLTHIHACWQLTLEGQRRVLHSLEPAQALELLLFNMACLPRLLDLDGPGAAGAIKPAPGNAPGNASGNASGNTPGNTPGGAPSGPPKASADGPGNTPGHTPGNAPQNPGGAGPGSGAGLSPHAPVAKAMPASSRAPTSASSREPAAARRAAPDEAPPWEDGDPGPCADATPPWGEAAPRDPEPPCAAKAAPPAPKAEERASPEPVAAPSGNPPPPPGPRDFEAFRAYVGTRENGRALPPSFSLCAGEYAEGGLTIVCQNESHRGQMTQADNLARIEAAARDFFGPDVAIGFSSVRRAPEKSRRELLDEILANPVVRRMKDEFGAVIMDFGPNP